MMIKGHSPLLHWLLVSMLIINLTTPHILAQNDLDDDDLESALLAKIARKRARRRLTKEKEEETSRGSLSLTELKLDNKKSISPDAVNTLKVAVKEPLITFLASSELISWPELKDRLTKAKQAIELFELKFRAELNTAQTPPPPPPALMRPMQPMQQPLIPGAKPTQPMQAVPGGIPGGMPGGAPQARPGLVPGSAQKPLLPPAPVPAPAVAPEEEEEEEEEEKPAAPRAVPGAKPATMTGIRPVGAPGGMPGAGVQPQAPQKPAAKAPGGMPMA